MAVWRCLVAVWRCLVAGRSVTPNKILGTQEISKCRQLVVLPVLLGDVFHSGWGLVGTPGTNKFCLVRARAPRTSEKVV